MAQFIVRRILYSIVTLFILSATIFLVVRFTGDPVALMAEASARPEDLERVRQQWGLDRSWPVQYVTFMQNAFKGELGKSFNYRLPVTELYFQRLPNSLTLGLAATFISLLIGVPAGITTLCQSPAPEVGSQRSHTEKTRISTSPSQKPGIESPSKPTPLARLSHQLLTFTAERMPAGIPMSSEISVAASPSVSELGKRWKYSSLTGSR